MKVGDLKLWAELLTVVLGLMAAAATGIADLHLFSAEPALVQATDEETRARDELMSARGEIVPYVTRAICESATANYGCDNRFRALDASNAAANAVSAATQSTIDDFNSGPQGEDLSTMRLEGSLFLLIPTMTAHRTGAQVGEIQHALEESALFGRADYQYAHKVERLMTAMKQRVALKSLPMLIPRPEDRILWTYRMGFLLAGLLVGVGSVLAIRRLLLALGRPGPALPTPIAIDAVRDGAKPTAEAHESSLVGTAPAEADEMMAERRQALAFAERNLSETQVGTAGNV